MGKPGAARLVVAGGIIGSILGMGATVGTAMLWVHNGLDRKVVSQVGSKTITPAPGATQSMGVDLDSRCGWAPARWKANRSKVV